MITVEKLVELLSENPAKIFGLYPKKGVIKIGSDADLVIYDPSPDGLIKAKNLHMSTDFNPFENMEVKGKVELTILRGKVIVERDVFKGNKGGGKFVKGKRGISIES